MKIVLGLLAALLVWIAPAQAQPRLYTQAELDAMLAPIALHPDGLVTQILIAATYPEDVAAAARWSRTNPTFRGEEAVRLVQYEPWDPAVKALVAFPELLVRMEESPHWLHDLGQAFLAQQEHVMDTVQMLRRRAHAAGHLTTTEHYAVYTQGEAIVVHPRTQIVYVHYYDPYVVYGPWWWPHYRPVYWRPWVPRPVYFSYRFFYTDFDWRHRHVRVVHRPVHVHHHHHHVTPGRWQHARSHEQQRRYDQHRATSPGRYDQQRATSPVQPHVRVPEAQRRPIVQSAPVVRDPRQQQMPAANGWSQQRRGVEQQRQEPRRDQRAQAHSNPQPRFDQRGQGHGNARGHSNARGQGNGHGKGHQREERRHRG